MWNHLEECAAERAMPLVVRDGNLFARAAPLVVRDGNLFPIERATPLVVREGTCMFATGRATPLVLRDGTCIPDHKPCCGDALRSLENRKKFNVSSLCQEYF